MNPAPSADSEPALQDREQKTHSTVSAYTEASYYIVSLMERIERFSKQLESIQRQLVPSTTQPTSPSLIPNPESTSTATHKLEIRTLGRVEIYKDGQPVRNSDWQAQSARELFLCLLAHPNGLTKEEIGSLFWSDSAPAQLKARFKNMVYRLRRALEQETVIFDDNLYSINRNIDYVYDVELFLEYATRARESASPAEKKKFLNAAIEIYQGEYLPDTDAMWAWLERERLRRIYMEINLDLGELYYELDEYAEAIATCQKLFEEDACMEEAHRLAMRVYADMGNRAAVVRQYEQCMRSLREEVDAPPSNQTMALFEMLMA